MYELIKICLFLFFYTQNVMSYKIYQLDPVEGDQLLPKIQQLLQSQGYDDSEYQSTEDRPAKRDPPGLKPIGKSVLVKRIIPHGYVAGEYEFDSRLNTVYKPLFRYHVQKPVEEHEGSLLREMEAERKPKQLSDKDLIVLVQKKETKQDLLNQIENYFAKNKKQRKRKKKNVNPDLYRIVDKLSKDSYASLRAHGREDFDPFANGVMPPAMIPEGDSGEYDKHKKVMPEYPFWSYWTYEKNLIQDPCPGNLLKVGNMCVNSLGHRRSADMPDTRRSHQHRKRRRSIRASRKKHLYGGRK